MSDKGSRSDTGLWRMSMSLATGEWLKVDDLNKNTWS